MMFILTKTRCCSTLTKTEPTHIGYINKHSNNKHGGIRIECRHERFYLYNQNLF